MFRQVLCNQVSHRAALGFARTGYMHGTRLLSHAAGLAGVALRSFAAMACLFMLSGVFLAGASWFFLRDQPWYAVVAAAVAFVEAAATGVIVGAKRALVMSLAYGIKALALGRRAVDLIFERVLGVEPGQE